MNAEHGAPNFKLKPVKASCSYYRLASRAFRGSTFWAFAAPSIVGRRRGGGFDTFRHMVARSDPFRRFATRFSVLRRTENYIGRPDSYEPVRFGRRSAPPMSPPMHRAALYVDTLKLVALAPWRRRPSAPRHVRPLGTRQGFRCSVTRLPPATTPFSAVPSVPIASSSVTPLSICTVSDPTRMPSRLARAASLEPPPPPRPPSSPPTDSPLQRRSPGMQPDRSSGEPSQASEFRRPRARAA